jgi:PAS domain S-box-containing protein
MIRSTTKPNKLFFRATVLAIGIAVAITVQKLSWQIAGINLPLFAAYPLVVTISLAFGAVAGVIATVLTLGDVLIGPGAEALAHCPVSARPALLIVFSVLCLLFCGMVALLERRRTVDLSSLLKDMGAAEERFRVLAAALETQLVFLLDHAGQIVGWYGGHCPLTGWTEREMLGMNLSALYPQGSAGEARAAFDLALAAEQGHCRSLGKRQHRTGSLFAAETTIAALQHSEGYCVVIRDMRAATMRRAA